MDSKSLEEEEKLYDSQVEASHEKLKNTHEKKEYTFSVVEKRRLAQQDLIEKFAAQALQDIINLTVLPRVGIIPNKDVFTLYDIALGRLTVFTPKATPKAKSKTEEEPMVGEVVEEPKSN